MFFKEIFIVFSADFSCSKKCSFDAYVQIILILEFGQGGVGPLFIGHRGYLVCVIVLHFGGYAALGLLFQVPVGVIHIRRNGDVAAFHILQAAQVVVIISQIDVG